MASTTHLGLVAHTAILHALVRQGWVVLEPVGEQPDYDLVVEKSGEFLKVQCKMGRLRHGSVRFNLYTMTGQGRRTYSDRVDLYGVFCPELQSVYLVPQSAVSNNEGVLRVDSPKNNQVQGIRWAKDFCIWEASCRKNHIEVD